MTRALHIAVLALAPLTVLAACERSNVNPPTEPADPITAAGSDAPPPAPPPGLDSLMPGAGPASFVGRWAAQASWCANTSGAEQPISISTTRFEGYENSCAITSLDQVNNGYEATLACEAEGAANRERVRLSAVGEALSLTWLNRDNAVVQLIRCPSATPAPAGADEKRPS
ncbi:hypothetical protein [Brevundimonas kwangchunensis]|uniref:hypothetical protein n=1 Tax=Brevundimonas kwangchunensis TaxID=322163 RepID=UPI0031CDD708